MAKRVQMGWAIALLALCAFQPALAETAKAPAAKTRAPVDLAARLLEAQADPKLGESLLTTGKSGLARWRKGLFAFLARNARSATSFFGIPPNRVVEMGAQIEL